MSRVGEGAGEQRRDMLRGFASLLGLLVPFTPIAKEGGLARRPRATLALIAVNVAVHLVAWPLEKTGMQYETGAAIRLAGIEAAIEARFLGTRADFPSSRLRGRNAFERTFWEGFEAGRVVGRDDPDWQEWHRSFERWRDYRTSRVFYRWGKHPANGNPLSWITSFFLHAGFWHLFSNMLGLWIAGAALEDVWGPRYLLLIYFASGLLANVPHVIVHGDRDIVGVGASGAVAGLFGAFLVRMAGQRLRFVILPMLPTVALPGWIAFLPWGLLEIRNALSGVVSGVNHWVHVGGLATGAIVALALRFGRADERARAELAGIDRRSASRRRERLEAEADLRFDRHDRAEATRLLVEGSRADPGPHSCFRRAMQGLLLAGRGEEAASLARESLASLWASRRTEEHAEAFLMVREQGLALELPSLELLHAADGLAPRRPREAAECLHGLLSARPEDRLAKPALNRYADLLDRLGDPAGARAARARIALLPKRQA